MIILGVDPGTLITGYGVVKAKGTSVSVLDVGVIASRASESMPLRLRRIYAELCKVIEKFHPDELAIETAFYSKNAQSALKIGQARGVLILAGVNFEVPITEYSPREIKKSVVGNGAASKEQVQFMMKNLLHLAVIPKHFDATDALAVAVCHSHRILRPRSAFKSWESFVDAHPERVVKNNDKSKRKN
ncbi:MAG TPA: crossover junction endodeoxyribonuclease RuvC [Bacteroidota bacterium]|nr:crossover junction endodeoxyribonuclease RuvC [Bacteroidota bacterium]